MKITEIFSKKQQTFSFEFFPPKTDQGLVNLLNTIAELRECVPDFVSVTYGAMGTTRDKTIAITGRIQNELGITAMSHLTCVGSTAADIDAILERLQQFGVENIMALRGDPPGGNETFKPTPGGFQYGTDLIRRIKDFGGFCIGGAGYPEGHVEAKSYDLDLDFLKMKMDLGADFIVTQLFLSNDHYYRFRDAAKGKGVTLRLIPGIMPVTNHQQITKFAKLCGCTIPDDLITRLDAVSGNADDVRRIGIEHAAAQCRDLLRNGAPGIHFYTLNKSSATREIYAML